LSHAIFVVDVETARWRQKMGWATFWAIIFTRTHHLVTLQKSLFRFEMAVLLLRASMSAKIGCFGFSGRSTYFDSKIMFKIYIPWYLGGF
jgi:hypothetical protein